MTQISDTSSKTPSAADGSVSGAPTGEAAAVTENKITPTSVGETAKPKVFTFAALDLVNKLSAPLAPLGIRLPCVESLDANGYIKEPETKKAAVAETEQKLKTHLAKPEVKKLDPQSKEYKQSVATYLQSETQFPLLPP